MRVLAPVLILLIYVALPQEATARDYQRNTDLQQETRGISSINDLLPDLDSLDCTPRCDGAAACAQFSNIDSCLDNDEGVRGCFWSCE